MITPTLIQAVKSFEGLSLKAYKCPAGVWTIGYGRTRGVTRDMKINESTAEAWLKEDLTQAAREVQALTKGKRLTTPQLEALTDFVYNLGATRLKQSTLLKRIMADTPASEIQAEFRKWVYAGKTKLAGLVKRREWETQRFLEGD